MYGYYEFCENSPCIIRREKLPAIPEPRLPAFLSPQQVVLRQHPPVPSQQSVWTITVLSPRSYLQVCAALNKSRGSRYERTYLGKKRCIQYKMKITELWPYSASSFGRREMKSLWNWGSITWDEASVGISISPWWMFSIQNGSVSTCIMCLTCWGSQLSMSWSRASNRSAWDHRENCDTWG